MGDRCPVCKQRPTQNGWLPFCCEVCWDSADAQMSREIEQGKYNHEWFLRHGHRPQA